MNSSVLCTSVARNLKTANQQDAFYLSLTLAHIENNIEEERMAIAQFLHAPAAMKLNKEYEEMNRQLITQQSQLKMILRQLNRVVCGTAGISQQLEKSLNDVLNYLKNKNPLTIGNKTADERHQSKVRRNNEDSSSIEIITDALLKVRH